MIKKTATALILFLMALAGYAQGHVPTLGSNNAWTGYNSFVAGHLSYGTTDQPCPNNEYQAGYHAADFSPICLSFSTVNGVTSLNTLTGNLTLANPDGNLSIQLQGQSTININCPGCGGTGGTPGGLQGAIQYKTSGGGFGGVVVTGILKGNGSNPPTQAIAGTDFALPFVINCGSGISCPLVGSTYTFSLTGMAGTGNVGAGNFGQLGGYAADGGSTTIGGWQNLYAVNPNWSLSQFNALFSRFNYSAITSWSVSGGVATFQAVNSWSAGETVTFSGLTTGSCFNGSFYVVSATGLSNNQFEVPAGGCTGSATESGKAYISPLSVTNGPNGLVLIPPGLIDSPSSAWTNLNAQTLDWRKGYAWQQLSQYGVKCDETSFNVTLTAGSSTVNVGSSLSASSVGMTMVVGQQVGYGNYGTQWDWEPTITAFNYPNITLSGPAPFNYSGVAYFGTNNQVALTQAAQNVSGTYPLYIPTGCGILTDTVRWNFNLVGQQMNYSKIVGFPGHDVFQAQDGTPITAWSINTSTGVTTFTIPAYAAHNIIADNGTTLLGDNVYLENFPVSTFFNNSTVQIASQPTPTTFTVNSVFGQSSSSSSTESGLAAPTTATNTNGLRLENHSYFVNNAIDPSFKWTHYAPNGTTTTVEPPMYRPLDVYGEPANNPLGPAWGTAGVNGVAKTTAGSNVICISTTAIPSTPYVPSGQYPRIPAVGTTIVFPYQTTWFSTTVSSNTGSCPTNYTGSTLAANLPSASAFTGTQTEWFTYTTPQTLAVSIASTITYPHTITLALPANIVSGYESNISSHGRININGDQFDYMGANYSSLANTATLSLVDGPTSINGGAGDPVGAIVFPMNPCQAMYNQPYPVVPSQSTTSATPAYAVYYPGLCGGNAALALPNADAIAYTPESTGLSVAYFNNIGVNPTQANALGQANNNGGMFLYTAGNNGGYGNTFNDIRDNYTWGGIMQGPSSVNEHGVRVVGPTNTGQSIANCTFRTGYPISLTAFEQGNIDRCDTYTTEVSPYDGTAVGAATALYMALTLSELDGQGVTNTSQITVKDFNGEPENGNHEEYPPSVESDCSNCSFLQTIFEGGFNIFGGSYQILHGTYIAGPVFNYGSNNYFEHLYGLSLNYTDSNLYTGLIGFYNWGQNSTCQVQVGSSGAMRNCGVGFVQDYNGHDAWATMMGNLVHPTENLLGGMIVPGEMAAAGLTTYFDSTELWWGQHSECAIGTSLECILSQFDGFSGYIFVGPHERIADTQSVVKANLRLKNSGTATVRIQIFANNGGVPPVVGSNTFTVTSSSWTPIQLPVDFTGYAGDSMEIVIDQGSASNTLEIGYFNFVPFPGQIYLPLGTPTESGTCPVAGEMKIDSTHLWVCAPSTGSAFGAGTWKNVGIS